MSDDAANDTAYLTAIVPVMRSLGVTEFGVVKLGPTPSQQTDDQAKPTNSPDIEQKRRDERRRIALASSPGLVRRLDGGDSRSDQ